MPSAPFRWCMIALMGVLLLVAPYYYYRNSYTHAKRLRAVTEGRFYRSGCMTASGFRDAIQRHGIKTVINLMEENPDPNLPEHYLGGPRILESELCKEMGVDFHLVTLNLRTYAEFRQGRPVAIDNYLKVLDKAQYPVLLHCKAGLHRTGCLTAIYRMEYEKWSVDEAMLELKGHGFGDRMATSFNPYITQYVLTYQPGQRNQASFAHNPR